MASSKSYLGVKKLYILLCLAAALYMTYLCIRNYIADEDICLVDYKEFHDTVDDIYPSISVGIFGLLCDRDEKVDPKHYMDFLSGDSEWNETLTSINYDDATIDLNKHLIDYRVWYEDEYIALMEGRANKSKGELRHSNVTFQNTKSKMFTFDTEL